MGLEVAELICKLTGMERVVHHVRTRRGTHGPALGTGRYRSLPLRDVYGLLSWSIGRNVGRGGAEQRAARVPADGTRGFPASGWDALVLPNNDRKSLDTIRR